MIVKLARWLWDRVSGRYAARKMVDEFIERFPGKCMICSYHRYGVLNGLTHGPPEPHDCIEEPK